MLFNLQFPQMKLKKYLPNKVIVQMSKKVVGEEKQQ